MITITQQPESFTFNRNDELYFSVSGDTDVVDGYLTYNWEYDNGSGWTPIALATANTANLTIYPNATFYGTADYRCVLQEFESNGSATGVTEPSTLATATQFVGRAKVVKTNTRNASKVKSRLAKDLEFTPEEGIENLVGGQYQFGEAGIEQSYSNIEYASVQASLVDCATTLTTPVGGIVINKTNLNPEGASQVSLLTFSGVVDNGDPGSSDPVTIELFGRRIEVPDNAIEGQVRDIVAAEMSQIETAENLYFYNVSTNGLNSILFEHRDHRAHETFETTQFGATIVLTVATPARFGYGRWTLLAESSITDINTNPITLRYWERTS